MDTTEEPYAFVILDHCISFYCSFCGRKAATILRCTACQTLVYCSSICQKNDWTDHRKECRNLKSFSGDHSQVPHDSVRILARIIYRLQRERKHGITFRDSASRGIADLWSHEKLIRKDKLRRKQYLAIRTQLGSFLPNDDIPDDEEMFRLFCQVLVNAMACGTSRALYVYFSILDHSCNPEVSVRFEESRTAVLSPLKPGVTFENIPLLTHSYLDVFKTTSERRQMLRDQWYFHCECDHCLNEQRDRNMHSIQCEDPACMGKTAPTIECNLCSICSTAVSAERKSRVEQLMTSAEKVQAEDSEGIDEIKRIYKQMTALFTAGNIHRVRLALKYRDALLLSHQKQDNQLIINLTRLVLEAYREYLNDYEPLIAFEQFILAKTLKDEGRQKETDDYLQKAVAILQSGSGSELSIMLEQIRAFESESKATDTSIKTEPKRNRNKNRK